MFFFRPKETLRKKYNERLLTDIYQARAQWDVAKHTQDAVYDVDDELEARTKLARARYEFLFKEARRRHLKGELRATVERQNWFN
ncbi:MAG: YaaL family protein [Ligilactobacillus sp.]|nr:YaaL family protein [Ligilactobacillus sp.]